MYKGYIYKISNNINSKVYIGQTTEKPSTYWNWHKSRANRGIKKLLYDAMRKFGVEHFQFEVIDRIEGTDLDKFKTDLYDREQFFIEKYDSKTPKGYNLTDGGPGALGNVQSEETREKIRVSKLGVPRPTSVINALRKPKTEEHKAKLRIPKTEEHKAKLRKPKSEEYKRKMSEVKRGQNEGKKNPFYGKKHSEESVELIRVKNREYANDPENKLYNILSQPNRTAVAMLDKDTGEILKEFISVREAKSWLANNTKYKGDIGTIKKAVEKGNVSYGHKWVEIKWKVNNF